MALHQPHLAPSEYGLPIEGQVSRREATAVFRDALARVGQFPNTVMNRGNTCYRVSMLHAFLHTPAFVSWLHRRARLSIHRKRQHRCWIGALSKLARSTWGARVENAQTEWEQMLHHFQGGLEEVNLNSTEQLDANLYFNATALLFNDTCSRLLTPSWKAECRQLRGLFAVDRSVIHECRTCGTSHVKPPERDWRITVAVPYRGTSILLDLMDTAMSNIMSDLRCCGAVTGTNKDGDPVREDTPHREERRFLTAPRVLVISLNLLSHAPDTGLPRKCQQPVVYPRVLQLDPWAHPSLLAHRPLEYELNSVVAHQGGVRRGGESYGHYKTWTRGPAGDYILDDDVITLRREYDPASPEAEEYIEEFSTFPRERTDGRRTFCPVTLFYVVREAGRSSMPVTRSKTATATAPRPPREQLNAEDILPTRLRSGTVAQRHQERWAPKPRAKPATTKKSQRQVSGKHPRKSPVARKSDNTSTPEGSLHSVKSGRVGKSPVARKSDTRLTPESSLPSVESESVGKAPSQQSSTTTSSSSQSSASSSSEESSSSSEDSPWRESSLYRSMNETPRQDTSQITQPPIDDSRTTDQFLEDLLGPPEHETSQITEPAIDDSRTTDQFLEDMLGPPEPESSP